MPINIVSDIIKKNLVIHVCFIFIIHPLYRFLQTNVGPILLSVNPYHDVGNPLTLSSTRSVPLAPQLRKIVQEAVRQQAETGYPQAIILSGK